MSEQILGLIAFLKLILLACCSYIYMYAGRDNTGKWWRRFLMPVIFIAGLSGLAMWQGSFSWWYLLSCPLMMGALCLGYGGDDFETKLKRRFFYGLALGGMVGLPIVIISGQWVLIGFQMVLAVVSSIILGVMNPIEAAQEESLLFALSVILVPFMI